MALPWELVENILSRVPTKSLVRFGVVCKQWYALSRDKTFLKTQTKNAIPQFILGVRGRPFSVHVNLDDVPTIEVRKVSVHVPSALISNGLITSINYCDGLLVCNVLLSGTVLMNPLLRQCRHIINNETPYMFYGIGYDNSKPEISYKILGSYFYSSGCHRLAIHECASSTWKFINAPFQNWPIKEPLDKHMSLNGNAYWTAYNMETSEYSIRMFDFSREELKHFCGLPCKKNEERDTHYLSIFRVSRFSMLEQCCRTREIEIWVTEKEIGNGEDVVWIKFMTLSVPNFPMLFKHWGGPSYFVVDSIRGKSFIMCCNDNETDERCICIARGNKSWKIKVGSEVGEFSHSIFVPSYKSIVSNQDINQN